MNPKNRIKSLAIAVLLLVALPVSVYAWSSHAYLTYSALRGLSPYGEEVAAEPLEDFLAKQEGKIGELLKAHEAWCLANIPSYPALPPALDFLGSKETNLRLRFLKAIRVNPEMEIPLFVMHLPGRPVREGQPLPKAAVSILDRGVQKDIYFSLQPGEKVSALEVVASASEEPDYGLDIGLWEDNDTPFGKEYGYGKQPFGNPKLHYGTQAPFHMGFYHEAGIVYAAAASFKKTFPEQRAHLFHSLAKLAFQTGHPYWGYRFAGWGLHYLQDMTMPYHSTIMPGRSAAKMLSVAILDMIGISGPKKSAVSEVSRAHILIEKLLGEEMRSAFKNNDDGYFVFKALGDTTADAAYPAYFDRFPSQVAAKESRGRAKDLAAATKAIITDKKSYLDIERISSEGEYDPRIFIKGAPEKKLQQYNKIIENQMRSLGAFSRLYLRSLK